LKEKDHKPEATGTRSVGAEGVLATVGDVKEPIIILVLFIDGRHEGGGGGQDIVHKNEDGLLRTQLYPLPDHVHELPDCQVGWHQVLLLVNVRDVALLRLLHDDLSTEKILMSLPEKGKKKN